MTTNRSTGNRRVLFIIYYLLFIISASLSAQENTRILSPDGLTYVDVTFADGRLSYSAGVRSVQKADTVEVRLIESSPLGLYTDVADFTQQLTLLGVQSGQIHQDYKLWQSKQSHVVADYEQRLFQLQTAKKKNITVEFCVGNNKVAYRYLLPMQGETACLVVTGEESGFRLPKGTTTFLAPQCNSMSGWKRTKPSYEEEYAPDEPMGTPSRYGQGYTFPCLFHVNPAAPANNEGSKKTSKKSKAKKTPVLNPEGWVLISETGLDSRYCASHLSEATADGLYRIAFPMEGENNGFGSTGAQIGLPDTTPWRTIAMGLSLAPIVETTLPWDLVTQLYEPRQQYPGGRSTWSWIVWQDASINYDDQVAFINLAASLGWEYCLIDGGWLTNIGRPRMEQLFALCKQKGINPFVWYNSNGGWNDAPQCARHCMNNPIARKREMQWLQKHGVKGIKVDFFAGDKQETIKLYEQILSDANDYGIQVIFHGCTLPRGWERMYPNYVGSEAVLASENLIFSQHFCDMEAFNATLHPFCRNAVGAMEFGGTLLQRRLNRTGNGGTRRLTGDVFELGTAIAFQNPVQNFALTPMNLDENTTPKFEIDFMRQVPTTWDETRFIDGYPGRYVVLVRRHDTKWYVCALNGQQQPLDLKLQLPMLAGQQVLWLEDGADGKTPTARTVTIDSKGTFKTTIPAQCGVVLY